MRGLFFPPHFIPLIRKTRRGLTIALFATLMTTQKAEGGGFYVDWATGTAQLNQQIPSLNGLGLALDFGLFVNFSDNSPIALHFGIQERGSMGTVTGGSQLVIPVYPSLRLQVTRLFFGGGATPLVWQTLPGGSITALSARTNTVAYFGEAGILWPIIPTFSLGLIGGYQQIGSDPNPIFDGTFLMRFYFGHFRGSAPSNEFKGWRYPFGMIR